MTSLFGSGALVLPLYEQFTRSGKSEKTRAGSSAARSFGEGAEFPPARMSIKIVFPVICVSHSFSCFSCRQLRLAMPPRLDGTGAVYCARGTRAFAVTWR
jgi:hypothetical protein